MSLASGHEVQEMGEEEWQKQQKDFPGLTEGLVRLNPNRWLLDKRFLNFADKYYNFKFRPTDVVVLTYPKCGTTWMQEIVWTMRNNPDLNHPEAHLAGNLRCPFFEFDSFSSFIPPATQERFSQLCPGRDASAGVCLQMAECLPDPRTIKTHLPLSLLPPSLLDTAKVVAVLRNPKDACISYHHHCRIIKGIDFSGTFQDFFEYFLNGDCLWGPYWLHSGEVWEKRHHPNLHLVFYEDLKQDVTKELQKLDSFLATGLTPAQLHNVVTHTAFDSMKSRDEGTRKGKHNEEVVKEDGGFFRKGVTGDWKNKLTPEQDAKMDAWIEKNFTNLGIEFKFS